MDNTFDLRAYMDACGFQNHQELADAADYTKHTIDSISTGRVHPTKRALRLFEELAKERGVEWPPPKS
jgi:hypothetical protein